MKLDCSKISNKGDLMALVGLLVLAAALGLAMVLAVYVDQFAAGFFSATIIWKWHGWLYKPMDAWLDKLWAQDTQSWRERTMTEYERGILHAVSLVVAIHDNPAVAARVLREAELETADCSALGAFERTLLSEVQSENGIALRGL